jgi:hypothetical protein
VTPVAAGPGVPARRRRPGPCVRAGRSESRDSDSRPDQGQPGRAGTGRDGPAGTGRAGTGRDRAWPWRTQERRPKAAGKAGIDRPAHPARPIRPSISGRTGPPHSGRDDSGPPHPARPIRPGRPTISGRASPPHSGRDDSGPPYSYPARTGSRTQRGGSKRAWLWPRQPCGEGSQGPSGTRWGALRRCGEQWGMGERGFGEMGAGRGVYVRLGWGGVGGLLSIAARALIRGDSSIPQICSSPTRLASPAVVERGEGGREGERGVV